VRRVATLCALAALVLGCGSGGGAAASARPRRAADLNNTALSPALSQWLIGAISRLATTEQIDAYLAIRDDAAATAFIEAFWAARDPDPSRPGNPLRELFEAREHESDRRFSESGYLGRRTDRGTVFVLYGEPDKIDHQLHPRHGQPPVEIWDYTKKRAEWKGPHPPAQFFRFVKQGDLTVFYTGPLREQPNLFANPES